MNIHIHKDQYNFIINNTISYKFTIGSKLYKLDDKNSDTDYLIIYHPFYNQIIDPFLNQHQFQYKDVDNNIDYNLVDIITFIKNLTSGDSTINYELINGDEIKNTDLKFLFDYKKEFSTYNIAKAYLGFAKRDIRDFYKKKSLKDKLSTVLHVYRSFNIANSIINNYSSDINLIYSMLKSFKENIKTYDELGLRKLLKNIKPLIDESRNILTDLHNKRNITKYLKPEIQTIITNNIKDILKISDKDLPLDRIHYYNENLEFKY